MAEVPTDRELELWLLADYYRIRHFGLDRRGGTVPTDPGTGLPLKESDLVPIYAGVSGPELALRVPFLPSDWSRTHMGLAFTPKEKWTLEDVGVIRDVTHRIKKIVARLGERGFFDTKPASMSLEDKALAHGVDGLPQAAQITPAGLDYAEKKIKGGKYDVRGPVSILADAPADVRAQAPAYAKKKFRKEG